MPDYSKAKLYAIRSNKTEDIYIGSSCVRLSQRLHRHRSSYKRYKAGTYAYMTSYEIIKHPDNYIELLRAVPCSSREELHKLEGEEIRRTAQCVNKYIAGRTVKEYYEDHKEHILTKTKQYYEENKEKVALCKKKNYESKKEYYTQYKRGWHQKNKEKMNEKTKKYQEEKKNTRICLCGASYASGLKSKRNAHYASERHKSYVKDFYTRLNEQLTK